MHVRTRVKNGNWKTALECVLENMPNLITHLSFTTTHSCVLMNTLICSKKDALFNNTPETVLIKGQAKNACVLYNTLVCYTGCIKKN